MSGRVFGRGLGAVVDDLNGAACPDFAENRLLAGGKVTALVSNPRSSGCGHMRRRTVPAGRRQVAKGSIVQPIRAVGTGPTV